MYRQYEDPYKLQVQLKKTEELLAQARMEDWDEEEIYYLQQDIYDLKDRINFAWQDIEYNECH